MNDQLFPLYTPLENAAAELRTRRGASVLAVRTPLERHLFDGHYAVLFRQIATPNFELERFVSLALSAGLTPMVLEFQRDKFVTRNPIKYALARMGFHAGTGRKGGSRLRFISVADLHATDGRLLCHALTSWGQRLVLFHHELLEERQSLSCIELFDGSEWFLSHGGGARSYYAAFLSLFVRHAVLFESFLFTLHEHQFTSEIVLPSFDAVFAQHGLRPIVCRLDPPESEGFPYWLQYPDALHESVLARRTSDQHHAL